MQMTKVERIQKALHGDAVDRPPISFWAHNFAQENSAQDLAVETVRVYKRNDWDFIKIQSRASTFSEAWGNQYRYSTSVAAPPTLLSWRVHNVDDLRALRPVDPTGGPFGEQIEALRMIRTAVGPDVPILQTVFAPAMVLTSLVNGPEQLLTYVRSEPEATHGALDALSETLAGYAKASLENGADGIFFAIKAADASMMIREEYAEFGLPYDRRVLDAASAGWLNLLHMCGDQIYFDVVNELPSAFISYGLSEHNPSLSEVRDQTGRAVIGGVSPKPMIREMTPADVAAEVTAALAETGGVKIMIGPGCSISPDTPEENLHAAKRALEAWTSG